MKKIISVALALFMLATLMSVSVFADDFKSPAGDDFYTVTVNVKDSVGGTASADPVSVSKGETTKITAKADDNYDFVSWTFAGEFEWVEGDANSETIVIRPAGEVSFTANFKGEGGADKDEGTQSPETGYDYEAVVIVMAAVVLLSAAGVVYTGKKYYSNAR